jgi:hypothetical protein
MMKRSLLQLLPILLLSFAPVGGQMAIARSEVVAPQKDAATAIQTVERFIVLGREGAISSLAVENRITGLAQDYNHPTVVSFLIRLLKNDNPSIRSSAASGLGTLGKSATSAIPQLIMGLRDSDRFARGSAAQALGQMGAPAKSALRPLIRLLKDADPGVRDRAAYALERIEPFLEGGEK